MTSPPPSPSMLLWRALRAVRRKKWSPDPWIRGSSTFKFEFSGPTRIAKRPPRIMTPAEMEMYTRMYYHDSKVRFRCEIDHAHTCADRHTLKKIGQSNADGFIQDLYQCPSCHAVWTKHEAFR